MLFWIFSYFVPQACRVLSKFSSVLIALKLFLQQFISERLSTGVSALLLLGMSKRSGLSPRETQLKFMLPILQTEPTRLEF